MLMRDIEIFLKRSGMSATRFGQEATRDPRFVFDLRRGRQAGPRVAARVRAFLETGA